MDERKKTMYDLKEKDRIICECDKHPDCPVSEEEFTVTRIDLKKHDVWMKADGAQLECHCANLPNAKITVVKKHNKKIQEKGG